MKNRLLSVAIGDIGGMPYEFEDRIEGRTKDYNAVNLMHPLSTYTDDTVMAFAVAEALLYDMDVVERMRKRGNEDPFRGYGANFANWLFDSRVQPAYNSFGNGSAMRVAAAGFLPNGPEVVIKLATSTALPTHNHPEGIKGAVATALAIHYAMEGKDKDYIRQHVLDVYYPAWGKLTYDVIKPSYFPNESCQHTVPAAIISFLDSKDYVDCLKLAISLGGDADTLAAIAGPIAYAYYRKMPEELVTHAKRKLPQWMLDLNDVFDEYCDHMHELYQFNLSECEFSDDKMNAFRKLRIKTIGDLINCDHRALVKMVGGMKCMSELDEFMESLNLSWRDQEGYAQYLADWEAHSQMMQEAKDYLDTME